MRIRPLRMLPIFQMQEAEILPFDKQSGLE